MLAGARFAKAETKTTAQYQNVISSIQQVNIILAARNEYYFAARLYLCNVISFACDFARQKKHIFIRMT